MSDSVSKKRGGLSWKSSEDGSEAPVTSPPKTKQSAWREAWKQRVSKVRPGAGCCLRRVKRTESGKEPLSTWAWGPVFEIQMFGALRAQRLCGWDVVQRWRGHKA